MSGKRSDSDNEGEEYKSSSSSGDYAEEKKGEEDIKKPNNHELLQKTQEFFYTNDELMATFESFAGDNCHIIDLDTDEYKLQYTELYNVYKGMFEDKLEGFIGTLGCSAMDLYEALKEVTDEDPNCNDAIFGQILFAVSDFDLFMIMMRETAQSQQSANERK